MPKRSTLRLTTRSVTSLPATGRDTVYWDRDLTGFVCKKLRQAEVPRISLITD